MTKDVTIYKGVAMADEAEAVVGSLSPPRNTDVLFGPGTACDTNACLGFHFSDITYPDGYRQAAFHLAEHVCETGKERDFLIYPIVYLYRHHIEIVLKSLLNVACHLLDQELTAREVKALGRHDLAELWNMVKSLLNPVCELAGSDPLPLDDLEGIASYIYQLHEHDPDGQRFRYAMTKAKGSPNKRIPSLHPNLRNINIRNFAIALEKLSDYLGSLDDWFSDLIEAKAATRYRPT